MLASLTLSNRSFCDQKTASRLLSPFPVGKVPVLDQAQKNPFNSGASSAEIERGRGRESSEEISPTKILSSCSSPSTLQDGAKNSKSSSMLLPVDLSQSV